MSIFRFGRLTFLSGAAIVWAWQAITESTKTAKSKIALETYGGGRIERYMGDGEWAFDREATEMAKVSK